MTAGPDPATPSGDGEPAAGPNPVEHLQAAAIEMIAATRALLDVAEELVKDPRTASTVVDAFTAVGRAAARAASTGRAATGSTPPADGDDGDDGGDGGVQRIPVS